MLINNIDIKTLGAELLNFNIQNAELITNQEWIPKSYSPIKFNQKFLYKKINIELIVEGLNRQDCLTKSSNIKNKLKDCTLKFDDIDYLYDCTLVSDEIEKSLRKDRLRLFCELNSVYAYKQQITEIMNRVTTKTINVPGNSETPAILEITPSVSIIDIVITGLSDDPIIVKNLVAGKKTIVSGEDITVTVDGVNKFGDTDMWEFPRLKPGSNTITVNRSNVDINIKYKPRWI